MRSFLTRPSLRASALVTLIGVASAQSATDAFDFDLTPSFRGASTAQYAGWEVFTIAFGGSNLPDDTGSDLTASLSQTVPGAFITSTNNIYNPGAASSFVIEGSLAAPLKTAVLQVRSLGNPLSDPTFTLTYDDNGTLVEVFPSSIQLLSPSGGFAEEKAFQFDVPASEGVEDFSIVFDATAPNCSLNAVLLDVNTDGEIGTTFCSGPPNSTGSTGALSAFGSTAIADNDVELRASSLPSHAFGIFIASTAQQTTVFSNGAVLCLGGSIGRFSPFNSGAGGEFSVALDLAAIATPNGVTPVLPGETWSFQCWHRDVGTPPTYSLTEALEITFQ